MLRALHPSHPLHSLLGGLERLIRGCARPEVVGEVPLDEPVVGFGKIPTVVHGRAQKTLAAVQLENVRNGELTRRGGIGALSRQSLLFSKWSMISVLSWMISPSGVSMVGMIMRPIFGTISFRNRRLPGTIST